MLINNFMLKQKKKKIHQSINLTMKRKETILKVKKIKVLIVL